MAGRRGLTPPVELLAPAGGPPALQAALSAGADAVYLGLDRWSARAFAGNFAGERLPAAIDRAHLFGARVHLALNIQLKDDELEPALEALAAPYAAGLDAVIVADLGFAGLVGERYPGLELHASTQLDTHSSAQLELLARLGFSRAILARELSLAEIAALDAHGLELEVFVHGALCYGYSGDCLLSSMIGGRSGNRGRCSQSCRMKYRLLREGEADDARPPGRVLSTADLAAIEALPALLAAGVRGFKIEGRMKGAVYVATTTAVYREALDEALADPGSYAVRPGWMTRLEQSFSRGFTTAHLDGRHAEVRSGGRGGHRGVPVGRVESVDEASGEATVRLTAGLAGGDVIHVFTPWGATEPARVDGLLAGGALDGERVVLRLRERVTIKDRVFRLSSGDVDDAAAAAVAGRALARPVALRARLTGRAGERPHLTVTAGGEEVTVVADRPLEPARTAALTPEKTAAALGALGGTPYVLERLDHQIDEGCFLPVAALKELRRRAVAELDERRLGRARRAAPAPAATPPPSGPQRGPAARPVARPLAPSSPGGETARLRVVMRLRPGEEPVGRQHLDALCLDALPGDDPDELAAATARLAGHGLPLRLRLPEVLFDADTEWLRVVAATHQWEAVYASHAAALGLETDDHGAPPAVILEYPLQGLNAETYRRLAAAGVVGSPEATLDELRETAARLRRAAPRRAALRAVVEVVAFGRQRVLHTRDLLGRREGLAGDPTTGGQFDLTLLDAKGYRFPVHVTAGATRIGNARVTNLCGHLEALAAAGVDGLVLTLADMTGAEREAFRARGPGGLAAADRERFTTGHLFRGVA